MSARKLAIMDKLLPLAEAAGRSAARQTDLRRQMRAAACTARIEAESAFPCYHKTEGRSPWCEACRQHDALFGQLMAERLSNKKRVVRLLKLAVAYAEPEPEAPPEPKELLELIHKLEKEDTSAEADLI